LLGLRRHRLKSVLLLLGEVDFFQDGEV